MTAYRATLTLGGPGGWTMVSDSTVPVDPTAGVWVLDGMRQAWTMPDEWPAQPDPGSCQFTVAAIDPVGLPPMLVGTPVRLEVVADYAGEEYLLTTFHGRVSDATARPTTLPVVDPLTGVQETVAALAVEFVAVDYLADLAEDYIGAQPWPEEYPADRVDRIFTAAGLQWIDLYTFNTFDVFKALDVDHQPVAAVIESHFSQVADPGGVLDSADAAGWSRPIVVPVVAPAGGGTWPGYDGTVPEGTVGWAVVGLDERATLHGGQMRLALAGGVLGLEVDPESNPLQPTAGTDYVGVEISMKRSKGQANNRVIVSGDFEALFGELGPDSGAMLSVPTVEAEFPDIVASRGPITKTADSTFRYYHSATRMAAMYLGDRAELAGRWGVEEFTIYASDIPTAAAAREAGLSRLLPPYEQGVPGYGGLFDTVTWPYGLPVVLAGLQPAHRLTPYPWMAGSLQGVTFTLVGGEFTYDLAIRPSVPRQAWSHMTEPWSTSPTTPACPRTLQEKFPTVTYRDKGDGTPYLDPTLTYYDLRLTRSE